MLFTFYIQWKNYCEAEGGGAERRLIAKWVYVVLVAQDFVGNVMLEHDAGSATDTKIIQYLIHYNVSPE